VEAVALVATLALEVVEEVMEESPSLLLQETMLIILLEQGALG